ncbi:MAG: hypothetical protein GWN58_16790 [Anaerolineae bacterium]|nr:hypothetical protein [Anaerolineae bacterium]
MTEIIPHQDKSPINLGSAFDLMRPLTDRSEALYAILSLAADLTIQRDEQNTDAYADPEFRAQEIRRRTLKGIEDLRQIANMLELRWAIENGHETWLDADGAETSLLDVIEAQMPDEEQRKSSGRARQVWSFLDTAQAFREQGFSDQEIAECAKSGLSSALGITAAAQRKLEQVTPPDELRDRYGKLIEAAAETTSLDALRRKVRTLVDPTDTPPPPILYSLEQNGEHCWLLMRPTQEQWMGLVYARLKDVLESDRLLPEDFVRYWKESAT